MGDRVTWDTDGAPMKGETISMHAGDTPSAKVRIFNKAEDGTWGPTNMVTAVALSDLTTVESFDGEHAIKSMASIGERSVKPGKVEHRVVKFAVLETRDATAGSLAQGWFRVNDYTTTDSYGTRFSMNGCKEYLDSHPNRPTLLYGHGAQGGIHSALGHAIAYRDSPSGLDVCFEFDDFEDVPTARQAFSQLKSKTFDSFSVGFIRHRDHYDEANECTMVDSYDLPECSIVIEASNTGTGILQLSGARMTQEERASQTLINYSQGTIDLVDAITEMRNIFVEQRAPKECTTCNGSGKIREGKVTCPDCNGAGKITDMVGKRDDGDGNDGETNEVDCPDCNGTGKVDGKDCATCNGTGKVPPVEEREGDTLDEETAALLELMEA